MAGGADDQSPRNHLRSSLLDAACGRAWCPLSPRSPASAEATTFCGWGACEPCMNGASPTAGDVQHCCLTQAHPLQSQQHSRSTGDVDVDASERALGTPLHLLYRAKFTSCARHHELAQRLRFTLNTASSASLVRVLL